VETPRLLLVEVDVAQQAGSAPALGGDKPRVDLGATELADLCELAAVVLAAEHAHGCNEPVGPAVGSVTMANHLAELVVNEGCEGGGELGIGVGGIFGSCPGAIGVVFLLIELVRCNNSQDSHGTSSSGLHRNTLKKASNAMTDNTPSEIFAVDLAALAREIAMDIFEMKDILLVHKLDDDQWEEISRNVKFQQMLTQMAAEWNSALNTRERIRIKAATGLEAVLENYIREIRDSAIPLGQRVEAGKFLARIGEIDTSQIIGGAGGGGFTITMNIGTTHKVIEAQANLVAIEDAVTIDG